MKRLLPIVAIIAICGCGNSQENRDLRSPSSDSPAQTAPTPTPVTESTPDASEKKTADTAISDDDGTNKKISAIVTLWSGGHKVGQWTVLCDDGATSLSECIAHDDGSLSFVTDDGIEMRVSGDTVTEELIKE